MNTKHTHAIAHVLWTTTALVLAITALLKTLIG